MDEQRLRQSSARGIQWLQANYDQVPQPAENNLVPGNTYFLANLQLPYLYTTIPYIYEGSFDRTLYFLNQPPRGGLALRVAFGEPVTFFAAPANARIPDQIYLGGKRRSKKTRKSRRKTTRRHRY